LAEFLFFATIINSNAQLSLQMWRTFSRLAAHIKREKDRLSVHPHDHITHPDIKFNNNERVGKHILWPVQQLENKVITRIKKAAR